jgi:RimJ/RimL family protein N-acetyltransferase
MIETERLVLRPPEPRDVDAVARYIADPEVVRFLSGTTGTREAATERVEQWRAAWDADAFGIFSAELRDTGEWVGRIGLLAWDPLGWEHGTRAAIGEHAEIELGWTLDRDAWDHGYATEAAIAVRDWALREIRPRRLISLIHPDNARSLRVAERIGERHVENVLVEGSIEVELWALPSPA